MIKKVAVLRKDKYIKKIESRNIQKIRQMKGIKQMEYKECEKIKKR